MLKCHEWGILVRPRRSHVAECFTRTLLLDVHKEKRNSNTPVTRIKYNAAKLTRYCPFFLSRCSAATKLFEGISHAPSD